jgi:Helix-turn-helix domain
MDLVQRDSKVKAKTAEPRLEAIREQWQRQIMAAPGRRLAHLTVAVAISWHLNRETGDAWPGFATLAKETGLCQRTVKRAVKWLEARGHLHVVHSRGGNISNRYRPILSSGLGVTADEASSGLGVTTAVTGGSTSSGPRVTRTSKEPLTNLLGGHESERGETGKGSRGRRRKPETDLPANWTPSIATMDKAKRLGLSDLNISRELEGFRLHAKQEDRRCRDWDAAADKWMLKAAEFRGLKPKDATPKPNGAVLSFPALPGSP